MSRSIFGWSYPPGAANDPNAPWNQDEGPCDVCTKSVDACVCPECPTCGEVGRRECYASYPDSPSHNTHHLKLTREQMIARQETRVAQAQERVNDAMMYLDYLKDGELGDSEYLPLNPDPWG